MAASTSAAGEYGSIVDETISILENREREQGSDSLGLEEDMLEALDHETLLKVAKEGFKARQLLLKDLIATASTAEGPGPDGPQPSTSVPVPIFCVCGHCVEMPTERESLLQGKTAVS